MDEEMREVSFKSRNEVLSSISDLASYFSYDEDLMVMFGVKAVDLFIK